MRQRVFKVLFYLIDQWKRFGNAPSKENLALFEELQELGFQAIEIFTALRWLGTLDDIVRQVSTHKSVSIQSMRQFTPLECFQLDSECRGYLLFLEQAQVLTPQAREMIIERALAMEADELCLEQIKWLTLIVLIQQHNSNDPIGWIEEFIMADDHNRRFH